MNIVISSGHGKHIRGASGYLDEVDEARKVVEKVAECLRQAGIDVKTFHDDTSSNQNDNLATIVDYHNGQNRELDISIHFNAYETTSKPMGTECLYVTQESLAAKVAQAMATAGSFNNRGPKYRSDLYFLNNTEKPALLLETCFVDSSADADLYKKNFDAICQAIAESISGEQVPAEPSEPAKPEEPVEQPPLTEANRVNILGSVKGEVTVIVNGERVSGKERWRNIVDLKITMQGDVVLTINGQVFHNKISSS